MTPESCATVRSVYSECLKSDRSIIKELPEKMEANLYCNLTKDQASLYQRRRGRHDEADQLGRWYCA